MPSQLLQDKFAFIFEHSPSPDNEFPCQSSAIEESPIATVIIRGSTDNIMDDVERAVDDGVNTFKALTKVSTVLGRTFCRPDFVAA